jgi:O-antigen/teichoic acid export membrane protein
MTEHKPHPLLTPLRAIVKGAGIVFSGAVIGNGFRYLFHLLVARHLGPALFGIFTLGFGVYKVAGMVAELGLPQGLLRYIPLYQGVADRQRAKGVMILSFRAALLAGSILGLLIFLGSGLISGTFFHEPRLSSVLKLFALALPLSTLTTMIVFSLQGFKRLQYKVYVKDLFEPTAKIAAVTAAFASGLLLNGVLFAILAVTLLSIFLAFYYLKKIFPDITDRNTSPIFDYKALFGFSWPLLFVYLIGNLCFWTDTFVLGLFRTAEEVGVYAAAQRTALLSGLVLTSFHAIFAPLASEYFSQNKHRELDSLYKTISKWIFALTLPLCSLLLLFPENILNTFGRDYPQGAMALIILALGWVVHSAAGTSGIVLTMSGRSKLHLLNFSFLLITNILLNLMLIPAYGFVGAAFATAGSIILVDIVTLLEVRFILNMFPFRWDYLKPLVIGGALFGVAMIFAPLSGFDYNNSFILVGTAAAYTGIYLLVFLFLGTGKEEKALLKQLMQRMKKER